MIVSTQILISRDRYVCLHSFSGIFCGLGLAFPSDGMLPRSIPTVLKCQNKVCRLHPSLPKVRRGGGTVAQRLPRRHRRSCEAEDCRTPPHPTSPTPTEDRGEPPAGLNIGTCGWSEKSHAAAFYAGEMREESGDAAAESPGGAAQVGRGGGGGGVFPGLCPQQTLLCVDVLH